MSAQDQFDKMMRDLIAGKLNRRELVGGLAAAGVGAAFLGTGIASAAPNYTRAGFRSSLQDATPVAGGVLKMGMQSDPGGLDPVKLSATALWHVVEHIYNRMTTINPDLSVGLELAESLEISEDGLTYTFKLHPGVKFHNGRDLVADDVVYSYKRLVDPATASTSAATLDSMADVTAPDASTVVLTLKAPDASTLSNLANVACIIVPKEVVEENGDLSQVAVGSGPFMFKEYVPNTSITLEKNPNYWEAGLPLLDGLEMIIASEDTSRTTSVVQGTTDFIEYAPLRDIEILQGNSDIVLAGDTNTNIRFLGFNMRNAPFSDPKVRQAISMVIDREAVLGPAVFGHGTPVHTMWPPDHWAALPGDIPAADIEGAKALLAEAGFPEGFKTTITSWAAYSFLNAAAVVIQEQLKAIGVEAELVLLETPIMLDDVYVKFNYDMAVTGTSGHVDPNELVLGNFKTGASGNFMGYSNPEVDTLIDQGFATTDQAARAEIYRQIQTILLADLPWVNLFVANQYEAMNKKVQGYFHIPTGSNLAIKETWIQE